MGRTGIGLVAEAGLPEAAAGHEVAKRRTGPEQPRVVHHLVPGERVEFLLVVARPSRSAPEGAANIGAVAEGTDQPAVEHDKIARPDRPARCLLLPRIGPLARGKQEIVEAFASLFDQRPEFLLRDAVAQGCAHSGHAVLGRRQRQVHGQDFLRALDLAGMGENRRSVDHGETSLVQSLLRVKACAIDTDPGAVAAVPPDQVSHLRGPFARYLLLPVAGKHLRQGQEVVTDLVDCLELPADLATRLVIEAYDRAVSGHEEVTLLDVHLQRKRCRRVGASTPSPTYGRPGRRAHPALSQRTAAIVATHWA